MEPRFALNYRHFTGHLPRNTKIIRARTIRTGYDEDTVALILAITGLALMAAATLSMLVAFSVL
jgi:hypothetical protein